MDDGAFRELCLDWFKQCIPPEFDKEYIEGITKAIATLIDQEKIEYLKKEEIYVAKGSTIELALEAERVGRYLSQKIVVDIEAATMEIQKTALYQMLQAFGVFKKI